MITAIIAGAAALIVGGGAGFIIRQSTFGKRIKEVETKKRELILDAKNEALRIKEDAEK
ncbi:MAG: ribonuclease Y, partial [Candidatus Berkelbacteria bacterium]|nr:ribonuclease Y [Candidatus Berkelbacteria bacterium]